MQNGQHDLCRRPLLFGMHPRGYSPAIVGDSHGTVRMNRDVNLGTMTGQGLIDTVVHKFVHQVVKPVDSGTADIHARSDPDRFQAFQYADMFRGVFFFHRFP